VWSGGDNTTYTNWATAAHTIQAAVNAASGGDTVWVTNGTYMGTGNEVVKLSTNITLKSVNGYAVTIIDGQAARRVITMYNDVANVNNGLVDGFTITNGLLTGTASGAGVYIAYGTVQNCLITKNTVTGDGQGDNWGGGVFVYSPWACLQNCIVSGMPSPAAMREELPCTEAGWLETA